MQLQFLAPVEFFLSSCTVTVFEPGGIIILYIQFCARGLSRQGLGDTDIYMYIYMCVLWCRVMSCVARRCWLVGWVGVVW